MKRIIEDRYFTAGPFSAIFSDSMGRILDQSLLMGNLAFTIAIMAEGTNLTFKTAQKHVQRLLGLKWVSEKGKRGNARTYSFNVQESPLKELVLWASKFQMGRRIP